MKRSFILILASALLLTVAFAFCSCGNDDNKGNDDDKKATAYAFINDEQSGDILVCLIDGEWYQFLATERAGQP